LANALEALQSAAPIVFIVGFAIQQIIQILDGVTSYFANQWLKRSTNPNETYADYKKIICTWISNILGGLVSLGMFGHVPIIGNNLISGETTRNIVNCLLLGLMLGTGTDGANSLLKYLGYAKDAAKSVSSVTVQLPVSSVSVSPGANVSLFGSAQNSADPSIKWQMLNPTAGSSLEGSVYTAPTNAGTYYLMATANSDPMATAILTVSVAAS
jgi:hypothetical protein